MSRNNSNIMWRAVATFAVCGMCVGFAFSHMTGPAWLLPLFFMWAIWDNAF